MIYVCDKFGKTMSSGHVGGSIEPDNGQSYGGHNIFLVMSVQADGDELEKCIRMTGKNPEQRVARFFGDDARFIVANWK